MYILCRHLRGEYILSDTIAAVSTAMTSSSGIGIVRMSGPDAVRIADLVFRGKRPGKLSDMPSHTIHYGYIFDGDDIIDEVLLMLMKAPNTYTREDVVEIDCHGGPLVLQSGLDLLIRRGARPADPGEFTKRAFLNGRIDLSQAEAVMDIIQSKSTFALKNSVGMLRGSIKDKIIELRKSIMHDIAWIEASLDDPEHIDSADIGPLIAEHIQGWMSEIDGLISENARVLKEGVKTVILGKPNAGKSSIMNVLLGQDRAIVTDIAGTTRDTLEEEVNLAGIPLIIVDTAGIHRTDDLVEKIGVDRARDSLKDADLIIYVVDRSTRLDQNDYDIMDMIRGRNVIVLMNKSDLECRADAAQIADKLDAPLVEVSAKEETGIDQLAALVKKMFLSGNISYNDQVFLTNARQKAAADRARDSLRLVARSIEDGMPEDLFTVDLMDAYEELGHIIGQSVGEDMIDAIFSQFCMGK